MGSLAGKVSSSAWSSSQSWRSLSSVRSTIESSRSVVILSPRSVHTSPHIKNHISTSLTYRTYVFPYQLFSIELKNRTRSFLQTLDFVPDMTHIEVMKIFALLLVRDPQRLKIGG
jgi:hypothetical protein